MTEKDALLALRGRLVEAAVVLDEMVPKNVLESDLWRISGKVEGVRLALSYVDEALRLSLDKCSICLGLDYPDCNGGCL